MSPGETREKKCAKGGNDDNDIKKLTSEEEDRDLQLLPAPPIKLMRSDKFH